MSVYENVILKRLKSAVRAQRREGFIVTEEKGRLHGVGHRHLGLQQIFNSYCILGSEMGTNMYLMEFINVS